MKGQWIIIIVTRYSELFKDFVTYDMYLYKLYKLNCKK
jgi:hypothetical protein